MKKQTITRWILCTAGCLAFGWMLSETEAAEEQCRRGFVEHHDQDGDGYVSQEEFRGPIEHFDRFDANGDGYIEEGEAPTGPPPRRQGEGRRGSRGGGQEELERDSRGGEGPRVGFVERLDVNGDGGVSSDEFDGPAVHFSHFDTNGDGYITDDEAPQGPPPGRRGRRDSRTER